MVRMSSILVSELTKVSSSDYVSDTDTTINKNVLRLTYIVNIANVHSMLQLLLDEDSDHFCLFNESERSEFLFLLFRHFCLGGQVCQYEDKVDPYLNVTKQVYKELIRSVWTLSVWILSVWYSVL